MVAKAAIVENGVVTNIIVVESLEDRVPADGANIGDTWDGTNFVSPVPATVVPQSITPRQGELILLQYSLTDAVTAYIDSLPASEAARARIDYNRANEWRRDWPWLVAAAAGLGLTSETVDQMFIEAAQL